MTSIPPLPQRAFCCQLFTNYSQINLTNAGAYIRFEGNTYSPDPGITVDNIQVNLERLDSFSVSGFIDGATIKNPELIQVSYLHFIEVQSNQEARKIWSKFGIIASCKINHHHYSLTFESELTRANKLINEFYSPNCRAELGDERCRLSLPSISSSGTITNIILPGREFIGSHAFDVYEYIIFSPSSRRIKCQTVKERVLLTEDHPLVEGEAYTLVMRCNKEFLTCRNKFNNTLNFRGEPSLEQILGAQQKSK